jgi:two-component system, OmpR family, response regulator
MAVSDTIMVVEDDDATREFLADHLAADSYGVVTAATGRQALNLLEVKDCDLVLLDVMLPDGDGFAVAERIAQPVVLTSSHAQDDLSARLARTSARGFVRKDDLSTEALLEIGAP